MDSLGGCVYDARYTRSAVVVQISMKSQISRRLRFLELTRARTELFTYFEYTRLLVHSLLKMEKQALLPREGAWRRAILAVASRLSIQLSEKSCSFPWSSLAEVTKSWRKDDGCRFVDVDADVHVRFCKVHASTPGSGSNVF